MLKLIRNTLSNTGAKLIILVLSIVATPVLIKAIGDEGYALLMLIPTITGYFDLLSAGVPGGAVKFIAEYEAKKDWVMVNKIINSSLLFFLLIGGLISTSLVIFTLSDGLDLFHITEANRAPARIILLIAAGLALFSWPSTAFSSALEGVQEHHSKNVAMTATTLLAVGGAIGAATLGATIIEVFIVQQVAYVLRWIWMVRIMREVIPEFRLDLSLASLDVFKMIFGLSMWMLLMAIASMLTYKFDEIIIGVALPVAMLTVYSVIMRPFRLVQQASAMFNSAIAPAVSAQESTQGRAGLDVFIYTGARYNNLFVGPLAITSTYFCAPFIALWVGERFLEWIWIAQLSCVFQLMWQSNSMLGRVFFGSGKVERLAIIALVSAALNAALSAALVQVIGVEGVLLATMCVACLAIPAQYVFIFPQLDIPRWRYLRQVIVRAQWPQWMAGLVLIPLWSPIQSIRSWGVLAAGALAMCLALMTLSWTIGVDRVHKEWMRDHIKAWLSS